MNEACIPIGCLYRRGKSLKLKNDLTGRTFGRWLVQEHVGYTKRGLPVYQCKCQCGQMRHVNYTALYNNRSSQSCGCLRAELHVARATTHGACKGRKLTRSYCIWAGVKQRCHDQNNSHYDRYGGRGIKVCERWMDFANFLADMGEAPSGLTLDRIDNDGDYEPANCRWATWKVQHNNRGNNVKIRFEGRMLSLEELARATGLKYCTLWWRHKHGKALLVPVKPYRRKAA